MGPVLRWEGPKLASAVFTDLEKVHDMVWKEGVMVKMRLGVGGGMFNGTRSFLDGRKTQVKVGQEPSGQFGIVSLRQCD